MKEMTNQMVKGQPLYTLNVRADATAATDKATMADFILLLLGLEKQKWRGRLLRNFCNDLQSFYTPEYALELRSSMNR